MFTRYTCVRICSLSVRPFICPIDRHQQRLPAPPARGAQDVQQQTRPGRRVCCWVPCRRYHHINRQLLQAPAARSKRWQRYVESRRRSLNTNLFNKENVEIWTFSKHTRARAVAKDLSDWFSKIFAVTHTRHLTVYLFFAPHNVYVTLFGCVPGGCFYWLILCRYGV